VIRECLSKVIEGLDLTQAEAVAVMDDIMSGRCTDAQIAGFLTALRLKGETVEEICGFAKVMREKATRVQADPRVIDTCGTGGDAQGTFNISTAAALVAAGAGVQVAKHGNRSVSSASGSADVLRTLGVNIDATPAQIEACMAETGIGFLFAPLLHGAMKHAIGPRRELGIRTVFNVLGPLTNPAGARRQLLGVYASSLAPTMALVLKALGSERAMVVHGHDGLDEITLSDETTVAELRDGEVQEFVIGPDDFGMRRCPLEAIRVSHAEESAARIRSVLAGEAGPARDIVVLNAGAAIVVAGKAADMMDGVELATRAIDSGRAREALARLVEVSNRAPAAGE